MRVTVLRLGHRFVRDRRLSTHVGLTARAFGASELLLDEKDGRVRDSVGRITSAWGGSFRVSFVDDWKAVLNDFSGDKIHLTMYGLGVNDVIGKVISSGRDKLVIIGGKKVPPELYDMADYNVSVGSQPHSEVAALAVFLDRLFHGEELGVDFKGGRRVIPAERGKRVIEQS